ncbi:MAG: hypothetical protein IT314_12785 [Anaerolineales bacterium]|nr:hypothetical protein [Anaerolineales bacterium]
MDQKQVLKRYFKEFASAMTAYVIVLLASVSVLNDIELPQATQIAVVLLPMVPIVFVFTAVLRALRDSDELQQKIQSSAVIFSAIATGMITFSYGFLEGIGFPKLPTIWILPMMFALWGVSLWYFNKRYQ